MIEIKSTYCGNLPQLGSKLFIADGGLETYPIFHQEDGLPLLEDFPRIGSDVDAPTVVTGQVLVIATNNESHPSNRKQEEIIAWAKHAQASNGFG